MLTLVKARCLPAPDKDSLQGKAATCWLNGYLGTHHFYGKLKGCHSELFSHLYSAHSLVQTSECEAHPWWVICPGTSQPFFSSS